MEIADNIGTRLTCGSKTPTSNESDIKTASDDDEDIIEPDIDVGTYDDIVDESETKDIKLKIEDVKTKIPLFSGFLIDQLIGKK